MLTLQRPLHLSLRLRPATTATNTLVPRSKLATRNSLGSSGLVGRQLGTGHPIAGKIELVRIAGEDLKARKNRTDTT
jgi:hypothetical protein